MSRNNYTIQGLQRVMHVCTTNFLYLSYELRTTLAKKNLRSGRAEHRKPTNTNRRPQNLQSSCIHRYGKSALEQLPPPFIQSCGFHEGLASFQN